MKTILALSLIGLSLAYAKAPNRYEQVLTANDNHYQLRCELNDRSNYIIELSPVASTMFKRGEYLFRKFLLKTNKGNIPFSLQVYASGNAPKYVARIAGNSIHGDVKEGVSNHYKKQMTFNHSILGKVTCFAEFAYEAPFELKDGNYHINVHPHLYYDFRNATSVITNRLYANSSMTSLMLLEDFSWKENKVNLVNFLRTGQTGLSHREPGQILVNVPASSTVNVSAAGHNLYHMSASNQININYTGGNHNYCIWNNTRRVFNALMESNANPTLNITYMQNGIVVQKTGIIRGLSFSGWGDIQNTNLLGDLMRDADTAKTYHAAYYNFFAFSQFGYYSHRYASLKLTYQSSYYSNSIVLKGTGKRHIAINIRYK